MSIWHPSSNEDLPSSPMQQDTLNQNMAIRRFCAARLDQEHREGEPDADSSFDIETWPSWDSTSPPCSWPIDEEFSIADSFINANEYEEITNDGNSTQILSNYRESDEILVEDPEILSISTINDTNNMEVEVIDKGLELVHLLLACAEAVGCRDTHLANSTLNRIWALASPCGDPLQRVSFCFAAGLRSRLSLLQNIGVNGSLTKNATFAIDRTLVSREEKLEGFNLLYQTTPYIAFGFMAANEAICQAAQGKDYLHILDLGILNALQYPSLIRTLASRPEGPPRLRITGISTESGLHELEASMKVLVDDALAIGMYLEFRLITEPCSPSVLSADNLRLRPDEALFVNSITHLHNYVKESRGSLKAILMAIKMLNPVLLTVVEQDANHNGPFFLARFLESLHYYSAIFDSLEASLPRPSAQRMKIERCHFAEEIHNIVAYEGSDRVERHERADQWRRQLGRAGFQVVGLKSISQVRMLLSVYGCDGYTLASDKGCLLLGWKGRPIMLASAWQVHHVSST